MGIEYRGVICVGYTLEEIEDLPNYCSDDEHGVYEFCEDKGLDSFSPYYDADAEHCIYGRKILKTESYSYTEVENLDELIAEAKDNLEKEFGVVPKAYLMAHGW
jgi:hypothetical protein